MPESAALATSALHVSNCARESPMTRTDSPTTNAAASGRNTSKGIIRWLSMLSLHHINVFHSDGAAVAVIRHQNGQADSRLRRRDGEHENREDLPDQIVQIHRERHQVDIHRQ